MIYHDLHTNCNIKSNRENITGVLMGSLADYEERICGIWNEVLTVKDLQKIGISECLHYYFIFHTKKEGKKDGKWKKAFTN